MKLKNSKILYLFYLMKYLIIFQDNPEYLKLFNYMI